MPTQIRKLQMCQKVKHQCQCQSSQILFCFNLTKQLLQIGVCQVVTKLKWYYLFVDEMEQLSKQR